MGAIDVWAQIPTDRFMQEPWLAPLLRWTGKPDDLHPVTLPQTLAAMDEGGVDLAFLSAWCGPRGWLISNEEVASAVDQAPARLRGLISVDLSDPMGAVRTIREYADNPLFVGVRVVPWLWDLPPNDRRYYPVYVACIEAELPFCTQIGHTGPLRRSEPGRLIPYLEDVLLDFPGLVVVGGHVGFPWMDEVMSMMRKFPNFHVDTSAYAVARLPPQLVEFMRGQGAGRVLFGTNWPMISPRHCLAALDDLGLDDLARTLFLEEAARKLFKLH
jgi:predicted TIM-barrel fold metal-dependent hydrolase